MLSASWLIIPFHTDSYFQQLGTQGQTSALGTGEVDSKTHSIGIHHELDHSSTPGKLGHVADGQDTRLGKIREDLSESALFRRTDEQNATTDSSVGLCETLNYNFLAIYAFAGDCRIESCAERIFADQ